MRKHTLKGVLRQRLEGPAGELLCEIARHYRRWQSGQESLSAYPYIRNLLKLREVAYVPVTARQCLNLIELGARVRRRDAGELWALFRWDLSAMSRLVDLGVVDVNARFLSCPPLFMAAREGSAKLCSKLLAAGANPNPRGIIVSWNSSPLEEAACRGNTPFARTLLSAGAKARGMTPLAVAAMLGRVAECRRLLQAGASPAGTGRQMTPLFLASAHGQTDVVRLLLEAGAPPGNPLSRKDIAPLQVAAERGYHQVVELLLAAGAVPESPHYVNPPLMMALDPICRSKAPNRIAVCQLLLRAGAGVNSVCAGNTALHHAAKNANFPICELLMQAGANVNAQNNMGRTPLHEAAGNLFEHVFSDEQYACFLRHGGDESIRDNRGVTPRDCREEWDPEPSYSLAERLLRDGILQPESEAPQLRELSRDFLQHFERVEQGTEDIRAFPYVAAVLRCLKLTGQFFFYREEIVELLSAGADPSLPLLPDGNTPLHAEQLTPELCNMLLAAGADPHARNADGLTPVEVHRARASSPWRKSLLSLLESI